MSYMLLYTLMSFVGNTFEQQIPFHGSKVLTFLWDIRIVVYFK